ncbi:hypothetical protein IR012_00415 [Pseudomonas putida]|uniref:AbiJ-NTD4 domain-containing protein n=1 Tax=Pseudomonas putida TaxID=303 RepID=UPI0018A8A8C2|nr:hypothetical protein [Pseudomonas putida]MBF8668393.1 hypothetical protein [Pseudomonas putida]MBF8710788.1 hypothetical protein [Pseudomonas putida]
MREPFSRRHGYANTKEAEITIREDAPEELRGYIPQLCYDCGLSRKALREIVCQALRKQPDRSNWSDEPVADEIIYLLEDCQWYKVYDIIERILENLGNYNYRSENYEHFQNELNEYFVETGIGWKLADGLIEMRGPESFEKVLRNARETALEFGHPTAANELHEAISDLSRRPEPDSTGAIQHALASLECVAREITGDPKANLGDILKKHSTILPAPLDRAVAMAWGYASEHGRHLREGRNPSFHEAELLVGLSASLSNYIIKKAQPDKADEVEPLF